VFIVIHVSDINLTDHGNYRPSRTKRSPKGPNGTQYVNIWPLCIFEQDLGAGMGNEWAILGTLTARHIEEKNETQSISGLHGNGMLGIEGCEYTMGLSNHMNGFTTKRFKR
jgi:hypothetical protein